MRGYGSRLGGWDSRVNVAVAAKEEGKGRFSFWARYPPTQSSNISRELSRRQVY